jgi:hypothetical protein
MSDIHKQDEVIIVPIYSQWMFIVWLLSTKVNDHDLAYDSWFGKMLQRIKNDGYYDIKDKHDLNTLHDVYIKEYKHYIKIKK